MSMKKISIALVCILFSVSAQSYAFMTVTISNKTDSVCYMEDYQLDHGLLYTFPPQAIREGLAASFQLDDSGFRGPDITTTFKVGHRSVTLRSQENLGIFWAGRVHAEVVKCDPGLNVTYDIKPGSLLWGQSSLVRWTITEQ